MWLMRWWFFAVRSRWREIRNCPSCYKIGLDSPGPPGPDDIFTAPLADDEHWEDRSQTIIVRRIDRDSGEPVDLNREDIN